MSAVSAADGPNLATTSPSAFVHPLTLYQYAITHVFFPLELPEKNDYTPENDLSIVLAVHAAADAYSAYVEGTSRIQCHCVTKMLDNLQASIQSKDSGLVVSQLCRTQTGDILAFFIRPRNTAIIITKGEDRTLFELFEVSPSAEAVLGSGEPLVYSFPESAVEIPNEMFDDGDFQAEFANLICCPHATAIDNIPQPSPAHSQYIATLLVYVLRHGGCATDPPRITKRIRDDVRRHSSNDIAWRRSSIWLFIRITTQMSVLRSPGQAFYKSFLLYFMCTLARDARNAELSSDVLNLMSSKIFQRLGKLGTSTPDWLSEMALNTCTCLQEILDERWKSLSIRQSPFQNPSQDELKRDTQLSLLHGREYIHSALANHDHKPLDASFHPNHGRRGTINDFLSSNGSFFDEAYCADPGVTLYDVEHSVEQELDDWIACVTDVEEACVQLDILMDKYMERADLTAGSVFLKNPEDKSIMILTAVELFVALDELVVKEFPMFLEYSPEMPIEILERLFLRKTTSLHRLARVYQYISTRQSQSRPGWSILSHDFTEDSFAARYYDQSPHLQRLKARMEEDPVIVGRVSLEKKGVGHAHGLADGSNDTRSLFPTLPLHAKVVVFELQCPACVRVWRNAVARTLDYYSPLQCPLPETERIDVLEHVLAFQAYFVECQPPSLRFQFQLASIYPNTQNSPSFCYVILRSDKVFLSTPWHNKGGRYTEERLSYNYLVSPFSLEDCTGSLSYTSNGVIAAQTHCPKDLSLNEFITFAHLRNGGLLQWLNILHGLHSKYFNLHRRQVYVLLAQALFEVGPLELYTGVWLWHQDLQDPLFCDALLDELEALCRDAGSYVVDSVMMNSISLLLTRVLTSSPSEHISKRTISLLWSVRRKTFGWVQDLAYDLTLAPTNHERGDLLQVMAATCQSTFNVDFAIFYKLFHSVEDVDALLSCSFFIHAFPLKTASWFESQYLQPVLQRARRLMFNIEETLRKMILADASDYAVDLAIARIFTIHKPSPHRWEGFPCPNTRWLVCEIGYHRWQKMHLNLLDGSLRLGTHMLGTLPEELRGWEYRDIFRDQGFSVIPSDLPGMDFTTNATMSKHKLHFSLRGESMVVRAQCDHTNEILELIPQHILENVLPVALIYTHIPLLNLSTKVIDIRPRDQLWEESSENWKINCASGQYHMYKGHETLVDVNSPTYWMISQCFECLDLNQAVGASPSLFVTTTSVMDSCQTTSAPLAALRLSVTLPKQCLSFFVNEEGQLESKDFKNMVYDENQSIEALLGLESLLVLRHKSHFMDGLVPRRVVIPYGRPTKKHEDRFWIIPGCKYNVYDVDTDLGRLKGDGSSEGMQCLAYLHSATHWHRPDPLTGKTGAQAALSLLQSARCRSIMKSKALRDDVDWIPMLLPQINIAQKEIKDRYYWERANQDDHSCLDGIKRAEQRVAYYLFPSHITGGTLPSEGCNENQSLSVATHRDILAGRKFPIPWSMNLEKLLSDRPIPKLPERYSSLPRRSGGASTSTNHISKLSPLLSLLKSQSNHSSFQRDYITRLNASAQRVHEEPRLSYKVMGEDCIEVLQRHYSQCKYNYFLALDNLRESLGPAIHPHGQVLDKFSQWPAITGDALLACLASTSRISVPPQWKRCLVSFALLLLDLQRARRLLRYTLDGLCEEFSKELGDEGCDDWNPEVYPDWLLLQIEGNFLIRRTQVKVAMELMSPKSGGNTVTQVNMGEGKSSVIIPIAAAALADGNQLVRIIVPKALTVQMFERLTFLLGGLLNRPIYYLPFSRVPLEHSSYDEQAISLQVDDLRKLMPQCMAERGILLAQPEHVLSLKSMSVERQTCKDESVANRSSRLPSIHKSITMAMSLLWEHSAAGKIFRSWSQPPTKCRRAPVGDARGDSDDASKWLDFQTWMDAYVRDILDESDEILHARLQLVYTIGFPQHMDGYPERWTITQQVLRLVKGCAYTLSRDRASFIEYDCGPPGSFPHVRIVGGPDVGRHLAALVIQGVMDGRLPNLHFQNTPQPLRDAIRSFISNESVLPHIARRVEDYARNSQQRYLWGTLLLLRGLLASSILWTVFSERRWRVNYGTEQPSQYSDPGLPASTVLAVPFRAKDVPAPNTQFGHPDITIVLTCLSYYYTGLSKAQLRLSFQILLDQDNPSTEYTLWMKEYDGEPVQDLFRQLGEINLQSSEQWDKIIFPHFSWNHATIDFYLSQVVFPKQAIEFPRKISTSSWDLAENREKLITGFSGTNDCQWLLPLSVTQRDLDHQQGTNARVLAYLLQPENDSYLVTHGNGEKQTTLALLRMVAAQQPRVHVLLDVGAQILDLSNDEVARKWLSISPDIAGAIYFDEKDELMILTRSGFSRPLLSSPLSQQLDRCVVYLDQAHTRGTDIKMPVGSRAAIILGPKVTKDHLVQGCMRMRKLGRGHSVMFFAPLEVDRCIRSVTGKNDSGSRITTADILCWAIHETWSDIQQWAPYWAKQGIDYMSRSRAWSRFCKREIGLEELSDAWLQPEGKSLVDLYAPCQAGGASSALSDLDPDIQQRCKDLGVRSLPKAEVEEEQEREVNHEKERERELELPPEAKPAEHFLHQDVVDFVRTGDVSRVYTSSAFCPVFTTLEQTSAATRDADVWSPHILATADFCRTVDPESTRGTMDQYLRPVQWILSSQKDREQALVLLSPFEVHQLMPDIRTSRYVHLHLYAPRTSQRMKSSDDLKLYTIPPLPSDWTPPWALIDQLNVFAGQLYLRDYESYLRLCRFLDVPTKDSPAGKVRWNLFDIPGSLEENERRFSSSPLPCVVALLSIRNRGRPFAHTHMGRILQGQVLTEKDFDQSTTIMLGKGSGMGDSLTLHNDVLEGMRPPTSPTDWDASDGSSPWMFNRSKRRSEPSDTNSDSRSKSVRA